MIKILRESEKDPVKRKISFAIENTAALYASYMPFVKGGGLFIPIIRDTHPHKLGEEVDLSIYLMDREVKFVAQGEIIWITPMGDQRNRAAGIGVRLTEDAGVTARQKIENYLALELNSDKPTHTL